MSTSADRLVEDYLDRLERELADFPSARRRELVQEISHHIAEARAGLEEESETEIRNLLDRLGDPGSSGGQIVASIIVARLGAASIATVIYLGRRMGRNVEVAAA